MIITEYNEEETMQLFKEEGIEEGREIGVTAVVDICKRQNLEMSLAIETVVSTMNIDQKEAEALVKKYW